MKNSSVSFTSGIKFTNCKKFADEVNSFVQFRRVDSPWTADEITRGPQVYTERVRSCVAGGILTQNPSTGVPDVVMYHLNPREQQNLDFEPIEKTFLEHLRGDKPLQGFILGCKKIYRGEDFIFDNLENFMKKLKIPYSKFKNMPYLDEADIAYNGYKDRWTVSVSGILGPKTEKFEPNVSEIFEGFKVSEKDHLIV